MAGKGVILGERFYGRVVDAVRKVERRPRGGAKPGGSILPRLDVVAVRNNSGFLVERFDVLGLDQPVYEPADGETQAEDFKDRILFDAVTPVAGAHEGRFGILRGDLMPGETGEAVVSGPVVCTVDVVDVAHAFCDVKDDDRVDLLSDWGGSARILWKEEGTGPKWAVVLLGAGSIGCGEFQGMNYTTVTQNVGGFDFQRAYALPGV